MALAEKIYKGDIGTKIIAVIDTSEDISGGTHTFKVWKPDGTTTTWTATYELSGSDKTIYHTTVSGDLNVAGTYKLQPYIDITTWVGHGNTIKLKVYDNYK